MSECTCPQVHRPHRIVLTGGPGAGKTAVLEVIRRAMCRHVRVLPGSAGIVFGGGFPRGDTLSLRRAAGELPACCRSRMSEALVP